MPEVEVASPVVPSAPGTPLASVAAVADQVAPPSVEKVTRTSTRSPSGSATRYVIRTMSLTSPVGVSTNPVGAAFTVGSSSSSRSTIPSAAAVSEIPHAGADSASAASPTIGESPPRPMRPG